MEEKHNSKAELERINLHLKESKENLRLILDSTAEGIYGVDTDGNCTFCNKSCLELLGYEDQIELIGKNMHWQIHYKRLDGSEISLEECKMDRAFRKGESVHVEDEVLWRKDGTYFHADYHSYPQYRNGKLVGAVITFTDITERKETRRQIKEAYEQLRERQYSLEEQNALIEELNAQLEVENRRYLQQRDTLRSILDSLKAGIMKIDMAGEIIFINEAWKELFNYKDCEGAYNSHDDLFICEGPLCEAEKFLKTTLTGIKEKDKILIELVSLIGDKNKRYNIDLEQASPVKRFLNLYSNPCIDSKGHSFGRVFVVRDVSHQKEVERLKMELISTVSHELRTPMSSILGFSELLLTRKLAQERRQEYFGIINSEAKRLTLLINDFLDIQRMESGKQIFNKKHHSIDSIVQEAIKLFKDAEDKHKIIYKTNTTREPMIYCDKDKILQVLSNLLSNAIKYSPDGGEIKVNLVVESGKVTISITDRGLGIPDDAKDKIFTKFFRVDDNDHRKIDGTGLGLAICNEVIRAHGGKIGFESVRGEGSTFFFNLPCKFHVLDDIKENKQYKCKGALLIVEDDISMVNLIKETLKDEGLKMDAVASGEKALQLIEKNEYILIILDIGLSGKLNGWDIVEKLKSKQTTANIPIIISSIYENKERARKNGITNYLVKPFTPLQLKQIVKKACNGELDCKMMVKENESDIKSLIEDTLANKGLKVSKIEYCGNVLIITFKGGQRS